MDSARKLQRTLYRAAKQQPHRRFTLLYDKVSRDDVLREAWRRVKTNRGAAGVDHVEIEDVHAYGETRFLEELRIELQAERYRANRIRRVHIPKPGQHGRTRPLGIPTVKDRVVQMAVKMVIEPLFEADFRPCSYGFRPRRTTRMALSAIAVGIRDGYTHVIDVDLESYFDSIDHDRLLHLVERRVGDRRVLRLIRAWLQAGVLEEGRVTHPHRGTPQGGVISPVLSNVFLHEVDRHWEDGGAEELGEPVRLVRYADDMVLLSKSEEGARRAWDRFRAQSAGLGLRINAAKSRVTTSTDGFAFLGFECRQRAGRLYLWPRARAQTHLGERVRATVRSVSSQASVDAVIRKLNPVLIGWCTYFRVGNSNRVFHKVDWMVRNELHLWLRRKYQCPRRSVAKRWTYALLHDRCRLYRLVGKVSHLPGLERMPPANGGRRAGCGKTARPVR